MIQIAQSDKFEDLPAKLEFKTTLKVTMALAFYTFVAETDDLLALRMKSELGDIPESLTVQSPTKFAGFFNWAFMQFEKGAHMVWL